MNRHPQVWVEVEGRRAQVDADLAPMVDACWRLGIETVMSCQTNAAFSVGGTFAWMLFETVEGAALFCRLAGRPGTARQIEQAALVLEISDSSLIHHLVFATYEATPPAASTLWEVKFDRTDGAAVRFPVDAIPEVTGRLSEAASALI